MPIILRGVSFGSGVSPVATVAMGGTSTSPTYFVDSVAGNDANNGTSIATPKKTLNAVTWANNVIGALKYGSFFSESLDVSAFSGIEIRAYGNPSAGLPIIDGTAIFTSWTNVSGNVWQTSVTHNSSGSNRLTVYENDQLLTQVIDVPTCQATPGSFVQAQASDGNPINVKIQTSSSDNPNTDGNTYRITVRNVGLLADANATVSSLRTQRVIGNNGSCETHLGSALRQVLAANGTKHNLLVGSGTLTDVVACGADLVTIAEPSNAPIIWFTTDAAGLSLVANRVFVVKGHPPSDMGTPIFDHDLAGHNFTSFTGTMLATSNVAFPIQAGALTVTYTALFSQLGTQPLSWFTDTGTAQYVLVQAGSGGTGTSFAGAASSTPVWKISDSAFYDTGSNNGLFRLGTSYNGATLTLTRCVIYCTGTRDFFTSEGATSGSIVCNNCIFVSSNGNQILIPSGMGYQGDNNVFITPQGSGFNATYHGTGQTTLSGWQTATSQDQHSIVVPFANLSQVYPGTVANGDFRLGSTGSGATVAALGAGPQTFWDWNRQQVTAGQPSAWPNIPTTLAQSETYVRNPGGWIF